MTDTSITREAALAAYRPIREAICQHLNGAMKYASGKAIKEAARRIGLLSSGTIVADSSSEMNLAFDLVVFGTRPDRSRAIDRYARASHFPAGSIEATVLAALRSSTFHVVQVKTRHDIAGLVIDDVFRDRELWLMDEALAETATEGLILAARMIRAGSFWSTAGATVPLDGDTFRDAFLSMAERRHTLGPRTLDDPRLPEAIYSAAIRNGAMSAIAFGAR
jgi:hypothetical protein